MVGTVMPGYTANEEAFVGFVGFLFMMAIALSGMAFGHHVCCPEEIPSLL